MTQSSKKQPFEKDINGRKMRYCKKYNIWVNREGTYAYREYNDPSWNRNLIIYPKPGKGKFLNTKSHGEIPLDKVVAICFKPMPKDGNKYVLIHKDGNLSNCHAFNLEWKQVLKYSPADKTRKLNNGLIVKSNGEIFDKGKKLPVITEIGDRDTDRIVAVAPHVRYCQTNIWGGTDEKRAFIDDLMSEAEFVAGDKTGMKRPRVLHKDGDYRNFDESNLEWVEESSQEYQDYRKKREEDMEKLTERLNPGHPNPLMKPKN